MEIKASDLSAHVATLFQQALAQVAPESGLTVVLEQPRQPDHGEFASTIALQLAKSVRRPPREVAQSILSAFPASPVVERVELAGPGFLNVFLTRQARQSVIREVLKAGTAWGQGQITANPYLQVEFVSSNPTGPLHVGHGRGAAFGDSLANLLKKAGYHVQREYYVNDAGRQMDILTVSTWLRHLELNGGSGMSFPPNGYQGAYVSAMAHQLESEFGTRLLRPLPAFQADSWPALPLVESTPAPSPDAELEQWEERMDDLIARVKSLLASDYPKLQHWVLKQQLADCKSDLEEFGVRFDRWYSEQSLYESGLVSQVVERLEQLGHLYHHGGARWFRSTGFGDEKDRVVQRENGLYTYFASDIAYHVDKYARGFDRIIDVWGADHHGYIPRVRAALLALGLDADRLEVPLVQFVSLFRQGAKIQMSTRKGQFVTLRSLREEVGSDAARFFYILRKSDQHLDFDLDLAKSEGNDNPVYYVQYAYARIQSVLRKWGEDPSQLVQAELTALGTPAEEDLMQRLRAYPQMIAHAARERAPHTIAFFLKELAAALHTYYNAEPILVADQSVRHARLALIKAVGIVLGDALRLIGVTAPESM